jgi:hypothetical protein
LSFWRVKAGKKVDPAATYDALLEGRQPAALADLPVDGIFAAWWTLPASPTSRLSRHKHPGR